MAGFRRLRSLLYVPGNRERFFAKLAELRPDAAVIDLEDAVPAAEKQAARETVSRALPTLDRSRLAVFVRVNPVATGLTEADLAAVVSPHLDGVVVPKVESVDDLRQVADWIARGERASGLEAGTIRMIAILETIKGALNAVSIAAGHPRLLGVAFGSEDFSRDLGVERSAEGIETIYPRSHVALAAHLAGVQALDTPWPDIADQDGLTRETRQGRQLGYTGKQVIHPSHIDPVHRAFAPGAEEVLWATRIVEAYEQAVESGRGAIQLDGKLLDVPMVERARHTLAQAADAQA